MVIIVGDTKTFIIWMIVLGALAVACFILCMILSMLEKKKIKQFLNDHPDASKIYYNHVGPTHTFVKVVDGEKATTFSGKPNGIFIAPGNHTLACTWSKQVGKNQFEKHEGSLEVSIHPKELYKIYYNVALDQFSLKTDTPNA